MRLDALLPNDDRVQNDMAAIDIRGLAADSRQILPGYLFAALSGAQNDGRHFIGQAITNGAAVVLADSPAKIDVPMIIDSNPRRAFAGLASRFFAYQPAHLACVTGTNGKTSTVHFLRQFWQACGYKSATMGTLGIEADDFHQSLNHTTAEPVILHSALRDLYAHQITHLALEASSHGLAQYRLDGIAPQVAGFINLSRDHMDYHPTQADYFAAKQRLFTDILAADGIGVIHIGSAAGQDMAAATRKANRRVMEVGTAESALYMQPRAHTPQGIAARLTYQGKHYDIDVPLIGAFQLDNVQVALGMALAMGADIATLKAACTTLHSPKGRMQCVGNTAKGAAVYVDYAHTPDALEHALTALRAYLGKRGTLHLVFGCGGDRDKGKRAAMGAIAHRLADTIIITDDNPRHEDAATIRAAIMASAPMATAIGDRRTAIGASIAQAEAGDIVLIAGKGHESGQIIGDTHAPFNDADVAGEMLAEGA